MPLQVFRLRELSPTEVAFPTVVPPSPFAPEIGILLHAVGAGVVSYQVEIWGEVQLCGCRGECGEARKSIQYEDDILAWSGKWRRSPTFAGHDQCGTGTHYGLTRGHITMTTTEIYK